jgi:hypothetical protein
LERVWTTLEPQLAPRLGETDDPEFWRVAVGLIVIASEELELSDSPKQTTLLEVGACSHWIRPNQMRTRVAGGFAAPHGYGNRGGGYAFTALPEFDWSCTWQWQPDQRHWSSTLESRSRRPLTLRIALPTRTVQHKQAAVHTRWAPGSPSHPRTKLDQLFFFRNTKDGWVRMGELIEERS